MVLMRLGTNSSQYENVYLCGRTNHLMLLLWNNIVDNIERSFFIPFTQTNVFGFPSLF